MMCYYLNVHFQGQRVNKAIPGCIQRGVVFLGRQVSCNIWIFHGFENLLGLVYVTTPSEAHTVLRRMVGRLLDNELERMWKEAFVVYFERCPGICVHELRKTMKVLCPGRVTNQTPSEYRSRWACGSGELWLEHRVTTSLGSCCLHLQGGVT